MSTACHSNNLPIRAWICDTLDERAHAPRDAMAFTCDEVEGWLACEHPPFELRVLRAFGMHAVAAQDGSARARKLARRLRARCAGTTAQDLAEMARDLELHALAIQLEADPTLKDAAYPAWARAATPRCHAPAVFSPAARLLLALDHI